MKAILITLLCVAAVFAGNYETDEGVLVLTDKNFADAIQEYDYVLAEFYAPWCGHCKSLAPEYAKAAQQLAETNPNVKLVKVDCTVEKELASKYGIQGFPTLKFFNKAAGEEPSAYEGGRTAPDIVNWLKKRTGPASVELKSADDAEVQIGNNEVLVVFFGDNSGEAWETYSKVAQGYEDVAFAHTSDSSLAEKYGASNNNVVLFKKFDEGKNVHTGSVSADSLRDFINENKEPTVSGFDQSVAQKIFGGGLDALFLITGDDEKGAKAEEHFRSVAKDMKGKIAVSVAKFEDNFGSRLAEYIGVTKEHLPAIRLVRPGKGNLKYLFEHEITVDNIKNFFHDFVNEKLKPFFKSENIPEVPHDENVRVLVGKNFDEVVLNSDKHVLVEYYAPWCGHCKTLAPIYAKVATQLKDSDDVIIAKMDATANEVDGLNIQGFPTIKFYPKGSKAEPVDYDGERTEEGFVKYLKEKGVKVSDKVDISEL